MCRIAKVHNQPGYVTPLVDWRSLTFGEYERPEPNTLQQHNVGKCRTLAEYQARFAHTEGHKPMPPAKPDPMTEADVAKVRTWAAMAKARRRRTSKPVEQLQAEREIARQEYAERSAKNASYNRNAVRKPAVA